MTCLLGFGLNTTYVLKKSLDLLQSFADLGLVLAREVVEGEGE
jgi:hypothetical protein